GIILMRSKGLMRSGLVPLGMVAAETATPEDAAQILATLSFPNKPPLEAKREVVFVKPRRGARKPVEVSGSPKYKIVPVQRENDQWVTEDGGQLHLAHWKEDTVAEVDPSSKTTILI